MERQHKRKLDQSDVETGVACKRLRKCLGSSEEFWKPQKALGSLEVGSARQQEGYGV